MEIRSYKKLKGNVYEITLDTLDSYKLYDDIILKYELLIDRKIDKKKLDKVLNDNALLEAYYKALKYLNIKMRSELEIKKYLKKYELPSNAINYAIDKLKEEGYINSLNYAKAYVNDSLNLSLNGPQKMLNSLKMLGISERITYKYLDDIKSEMWKERIDKIINKKAKSSKLGESLFKSKMYSYLISLGYYSEDIKDCLENFHLDNKDVFQVEAEKLYNKLQSKYEGTELNLRFKNKMYLKGFDSDNINDYLSKKNG